jgi:hypothetical protein
VRVTRGGRTCLAGFGHDRIRLDGTRHDGGGIREEKRR